MRRTIVNVSGRPAEVISRGRRKNRNPKWGMVNFVVVRFMDGQKPASGEVTAGVFKKAKVLGETERNFWCRVDDLIRGGQSAEQAKVQARAELERGVLAKAVF